MQVAVSGGNIPSPSSSPTKNKRLVFKLQEDSKQGSDSSSDEFDEVEYFNQEEEHIPVYEDNPKTGKK